MSGSTELNLYAQQVGLNRMMQQVQAFEFSAFVRLFNRRKNVIAGVTIALTLTMTVLAFILPPRYQGVAIVMQDIRKPQSPGID